MKGYKYLVLISGMFSSVLILSNILSNAKVVTVGPFTLPGGTVLFPIAYVFGDLLTEVYGYSTSRKVIWTGFFSQVLTASTIILVGLLPAAPFWENQEAYEKILSGVYRINIASVLAYFSGEFFNSFVLAKMKVLTKGRHMGVRFVASTVVGEIVDSVIFFSVAFAGIYGFSELFIMGLSGFAFKVLWEIVALPVTIPFVNWLKRQENEDFYDLDTNFNPFHLSDDSKTRAVKE